MRFADCQLSQLNCTYESLAKDTARHTTLAEDLKSNINQLQQQKDKTPDVLKSADTHHQEGSSSLAKARHTVFGAYKGRPAPYRKAPPWGHTVQETPEEGSGDPQNPQPVSGSASRGTLPGAGTSNPYNRGAHDYFVPPATALKDAAGMLLRANTTRESATRALSDRVAGCGLPGKPARMPGIPGEPRPETPSLAYVCRSAFPGHSDSYDFTDHGGFHDFDLCSTAASTQEISGALWKKDGGETYVDFPKMPCSPRSEVLDQEPTNVLRLRPFPADNGPLPADDCEGAWLRPPAQRVFWQGRTW